MGRRQQIAGTVRYAPYTAHPAVCAECGEEFSCPTHTRYKRIVGGVQRVYCSYACFRILQRQEEKEQEERERQREEAERKAAADRLARSKRWYAERSRRRRESRPIEDYVARVKECEYMLARYKAQMVQSEQGTRERHNAARNLSSWRKRLMQANVDLRRKEESLHGNCGNDGDADTGKRAAGCGD